MNTVRRTAITVTARWVADERRRVVVTDRHRAAAQELLRLLEAAGLRLVWAEGPPVPEQPGQPCAPSPRSLSIVRPET